VIPRTTPAPAVSTYATALRPTPCPEHARVGGEHTTTVTGHRPGQGPLPPASTEGVITA